MSVTSSFWMEKIGFRNERFLDGGAHQAEGGIQFIHSAVCLDSGIGLRNTMPDT